jgi:hypothetical protein
MLWMLAASFTLGLARLCFEKMRNGNGNGDRGMTEKAIAGIRIGMAGIRMNACDLTTQSSFSPLFLSPVLPSLYARDSPEIFLLDQQGKTCYAQEESPRPDTDLPYSLPL